MYIMGIYRRAKSTSVHYYYSKGTLNFLVYESPKYYYEASDLDARAKMYSYARQFEIHMKNQTKISNNSHMVCSRTLKKMHVKEDGIVNPLHEKTANTLKHEDLDDVFELNFDEFETEKTK